MPFHFKQIRFSLKVSFWDWQDGSVGTVVLGTLKANARGSTVLVQPGLQGGDQGHREPLSQKETKEGMEVCSVALKCLLLSLTT